MSSVVENQIWAMNRINGDTGASDKGGSSKVMQCKVSETNQNKARATTQKINEAVAENDASNDGGGQRVEARQAHGAAQAMGGAAGGSGESQAEHGEGTNKTPPRTTHTYLDVPNPTGNRGLATAK